MQIQTIRDINDPFLKSEWERLEQESDVFPQSTYHWCATWWKYMRGRRKLHVLMAVSDEGCALAIAPLAIERHFGFRILRSIPVHFGDFYTFIHQQSDEGHDALRTIAAHIHEKKSWSWCLLQQISEKSCLSPVLQDEGYVPKLMTSCVIADFENLSWDEYLGRLSKNFRKKLRKRLKRLDEHFNCDLKAIFDWGNYIRHFDKMIKIHQERWREDSVPAKSQKEIMCWREAIKGQFNHDNMVYFQLLLDGTPAAYRLGFISGKCFYAWHTSFNTDFKKYHVGVLILAYMFEPLKELGIERINFMCGTYQWKFDWSPDKRTEDNYLFTAPSTGLVSGFFNMYHHTYRDRLREVYRKALRFESGRRMARKFVVLRQKLAGTR